MVRSIVAPPSVSQSFSYSYSYLKIFNRPNSDSTFAQDLQAIFHNAQLLVLARRLKGGIFRSAINIELECCILL